jgi:hypothetical protein
MKKRIKPYFTGILIMLTVITVFTLSFPVNAAVLTDVAITLGATTTSTATSVIITFTPVTSTTTGSIIQVTYDQGTGTGFTGGSALTDTDVAVAGTNITAKVCTGFVNGYFRCTITSSAPVTTAITITLNGGNKLTTPSVAGNYSVSITTDIGGTGSTFDMGAGLSYIANANEILVTALVPPVLALDLYDSGTTNVMSSRVCALGVLSINAISSCSYDVGVGTNNTTGATLKVVAGGGMTNGVVNLTNASGALTAGVEAYGFYISTNGNKFTPAGSYGTASQTVPTGTAAVFADSTAISDKGTLANHITVTHQAAMSTATQTGNYTQTLSYTGFTK